MGSHASAASPEASAHAPAGMRAAVRRLLTDVNLAIALVVAAIIAAIAFIANGGLQLGPATLVEAAVIVIGTVLVAAALLLLGFDARLHGGAAIASMVALGALTALSIMWSLYPSDSWQETNRTFAYIAAFAAGVAGVRLARGRWAAVTWGVLGGLAVISVYGLATKVAPAWLAPQETFGRLREPYGYWNAVGVTAAMAMPLCLWLGTRSSGRRIASALAYPLLGIFLVTMLLSFSRGSIVAAAGGIAIWFALVPLRLRSLALLVPSALAAGLTTAWAFGQSALTDDRIPLAERKDAGVELGLVLAAMAIGLLAAGIVIQILAQRRPLAERTRRRLGIAALAALAAVPVIAVGALALSERGIGGTISDRVGELTGRDVITPHNDPSRLTKTASVRSIYWERAADVWQERPLAGAGAGAFAEAQLRFRRKPVRGKHAHGYVLQTLADLGLVGLAVSLAALGTWLLAARNTLALRRGRMRSGRHWSAERTGLAALALVAVVFGIHSALDWTWFVPAIAITGLFAAGWVAGRGPLGASATAGDVPPLEATRVSLPRGRRLHRRLAGALALSVVAALAVLAVAAPWRAQQKGGEALRLLSDGNYSEARAAANRAKELNPLSIEPYFELAAIAQASGRKRAGLGALQQAVQVVPASAEAWRRLGDYYLAGFSDPERALPVLRAALFLDPLSEATRASFVAGLRARQIKREAEPRRSRPAKR